MVRAAGILEDGRMKTALVCAWMAVFAALAGGTVAQELVPGTDEIVIRGIVQQIPAGGKAMTVRASAVRMPGAQSDTLLSEPTSKTVELSAGTKIRFPDGGAAAVKQVVAGMDVAVVGRNLGRGKALPAREVVLYEPEPEKPSPGTSAASTTTAGGSSVAGSVPKPVQFNVWKDPAGMEYSYPSAWTPLAGIGANPVTFQNGDLAMQVRRIPVDQGGTSEAAAAGAAAVLRSKASGRNWKVEQSQIAAGGQRSNRLTMTGEMQPSEYAVLLGADRRKVSAADLAMITALFVPVPANAGREGWALEVLVGGPQSRRAEVSDALLTFARTLMLARQEVKEAPAYVSPMRAANTVQVENALRQVGTAIQMYFVDNDDRVPANWQALQPYLGDSRMLQNLREGWPNYNVGPVQLLAPGKRISELGDPSSAVIGKAAGPGYDIALYADGHVARIRH